MEEINIWEKEEAEKGTLKHGAPSIQAAAREEEHHHHLAEEGDAGRIKLPLVG
jgi:hypothetical protein